MESQQVDVLICGGGPVGLLTGYCLARYGLSTYIAEQHDKATQILYGRAAMIAPRSLEMLDQLDLADALVQIGFIVRGQVNYKDGKKVEGKSYASSGITDTFFDHLCLVRQMYTEEVIRDAYRGCGGGEVNFGVRLVAVDVDDARGEYKVNSTLEAASGRKIQVASKFIVGADGSRSTVRQLAGIPFDGDKTTRQFIRIDGVVKTDMPEPRQGLTAIDSKSHGSILWASLDHGRTRVGFSFPDKLYKELGSKVTQDDVVREAKKAVEPFTLEFETIDWWTAYTVGQRLVDHYRAKERILVAGDAAHTHSSAAAQGMNTGLHDAVNLSWKLAGHIRGWFKDSVLDSYEIERRRIAAAVIEQDKLLAVLYTGEIPAQYKDDPKVSAQDLLTKTYGDNQAVLLGLGIGYPADGITTVDFQGLKVEAGKRAPDVLLQRPGMKVPVRLYTLAKNVGKFTILVFSGDPRQTKSSIRAFREYLDGPESIARYQVDLCQYFTIIHTANDNCSLDERLGVSRFGSGYYDVDGSAYERYGISPSEGMVLVLRPDGTIGTACRLGDGPQLSEYFAKFIKVAKDKVSVGAVTNDVSALHGMADVDIQDAKT